MAFSMILIALFAKILPRKTVMTLALILASALAILISVSESFTVILALRFAQGMLLAGFPSMAVAYINEEFDAKIIGTVTGIYVAGTSVGGLVGRMSLSFLTDVFDWRTALTILGATYLLIGLAFVFTLPRPKHLVGQKSKASLGDFAKLFRNANLLAVYGVAAAIMGVFVCTYNFISYVLLAPPYELSQTQVGLIYVLFVAGTVASAVMGRLADKVGNGKILLVSLAIMFAGIGLTCASSLAVKFLGVGFVTYGFFGAHSTAASWVGKLSTADKARISAGYMLVYYVGASVVGTAGGKFLTAFDWTGVALFMTAVLSIALILSVKLLRST
ncbi:MAG: MFS transporter [Selenomonadaceae bacterium]|nr:MFS transporter [Selenomonadaceae bacterium]